MRKRTGICVLLLVGLLGLCACREKTETKTTLAVLGEDVISLEEAVFYTRMLQESWEYTYYPYYGAELWQEPVDETGKTLSQALKQDVMDLLTKIHLLCAHAEEFDAELSREERETIAKRARAFMEDNTPEVLAAAGADLAAVEEYLFYNQLAEKVAKNIENSCEPEIDEKGAEVGKLTYALFATTGTFDAEGNQTPFTPEELAEVKAKAESFVSLARELGDITAAGEEFSHTLIDVYFNEESDGGAHEKVAEAARSLPVGGLSDLIETQDGYYIVQYVSDYEEEATQENLEWLKEQAAKTYCDTLLQDWLLEEPLVINEEIWGEVTVEGLLTEEEVLKSQM